MDPSAPPPEAHVTETGEPPAPTRGTCPRCGSAEVVHLVIGVPGPSDEVGGPARVRRVGCSHPGHDRECRACGATWVHGTPASPASPA